MATISPLEAGSPSCSDAYRTSGPQADRTPRHSISEVAAASGLTAHTLRWYERIGLLDPIDRSYSGQRRYSDADLNRLGFLNRLRLTGMPVADMLRYVELARAGDQTVEARRDLLVEHREEVRQKLADLHATLAVLDYKINIYTGLQLDQRDQCDPRGHSGLSDLNDQRDQHDQSDRKKQSA
ncbi:MerR family transcriptional regulator [Saccharothrix sp. ST-888]|uniref:MerR family transcriptional regulator n=1 Tax=Saccharothrix sp. ST-888 TaxID=1427391 RepID=UPI0007C82A0C|nr:MerR family transcriptional regulator [Saccharothrix sp. ST-888]